MPAARPNCAARRWGRPTAVIPVAAVLLVALGCVSAPVRLEPVAPSPTQPSPSQMGCGTLEDGPVRDALQAGLRGFGALELGPVVTASGPSVDHREAVYLAARITGPQGESHVATWVTDALDHVRLVPEPDGPGLQDVERLLETHPEELPRFATIWSADEPAEELSSWRPAGDPSNPYPPSDAARHQAVGCLGAEPARTPPAATASGRWERLPGLTFPAAGSHSVFWTGAEILAFAGGGHPLEPLVGRRLDPATGQVRPLGPGLGAWVGGWPLAWTGTEIIGGALGGMDAYDPRTDQVRTLPPAPAPAVAGKVPFPPYTVVQWTGGELLVWFPDQGTAGAAYEPGSGTWRTLAPFPLSPRSWPSVAWTGQELVVWGGCDVTSAQCDDFQTGADELRDGASYDLAADAWTPLPDGPLAARDRPQAVWTGDEVVVWGGEVPDGVDGDYAAAYDPAGRTWRTLPEGPLPRRSYHAMVWSGDRVLVWGGVIAGDLFRRDGAAYDPATDTWTLLPDAPVRGSAGLAAVWTGSAMVVSAAGTGTFDAAMYQP